MTALLVISRCLHSRPASAADLGVAKLSRWPQGPVDVQAHHWRLQGTPRAVADHDVVPGLRDEGMVQHHLSKLRAERPNSQLVPCSAKKACML